MTKHRLEGSMKNFGNHIDPEKEEQLKWVKLDVENKVKRILKLAKGINGSKDGNKDGNLKKKSEIIHLVEDFHQHYESLYSQYEELRSDLKNNMNYMDDGSSTSPSDSESYYSPEELNVKIPNKAENLELEDTILKDKLTASSELKEESQSSECSEILKDVAVQEDELENTRRKLEGLEGEVTRLKDEIETLCKEKRELEERVELKSSEVLRVEEQNKNLRVELSGLSRLEEQFCRENKERSCEVEGLMGKVSLLQHELEVVNNEKAECRLHIENLRDELRNRDLVEKEQKDFEKEVRVLEEKIRRISEETYRSEVEKQELRRKLSDSQKKLKACEDELSAQVKSLKEKVKNQDNLLDKLQKEKSSLQVKLETEKQESVISKAQMEKKNNELINKIAYQQKTLLELEEALSKLRAENEKVSKLNFQIVERKIDEHAEEFRKQFEDKYRILSRRIRVAEQLHVENKEWCLKTKERVENSEVGFSNVKDLSLKANDVLISLDSVALKFEEYTANFLNRISKASCELKFAKDWAMRKNKALLHVKDDLDCLLSQLDDKEAEILIFRERVWKSENKVRELEKLIKEKEDGVIVIQEEKREAIRQLCVWIDYHRSRSDYYKKMLSEMNPGRRKAS